jgi:NDP-sugar pyrophosphorylase family protein
MSPAIFDHIPADTYYGMDKLIKDLMAKNIPVIKYEMDEYWLDIGRVKDYERAQADYDEKFK